MNTFLFYHEVHEVHEEHDEYMLVLIKPDLDGVVIRGKNTRTMVWLWIK